MFWDLVFVPELFETVKETVYVPAEVYAWDGFCWFDELPSPKSQDHDVGVFEEKSVKFTVDPEHTELGEVNEDVGGLLDGME